MTDTKAMAKSMLEANTNITELHATADGNLFTDAKKAAKHNARYVKKEVVVYNRKSFPKAKQEQTPPTE